MAITCTNYDEWIAYWYTEIYIFCLVLVLDAKVAKEMTFQAYLRLGASRPGLDKASARIALYAYAFAVSEAYSLKKMRRKPSKKKLGESLGTDEADSVITYLRRPFLCRASSYLLHIACFSVEEAGRILHVGPKRVMRLGNEPNMDRVEAACEKLHPGEEWQNELSDRLHMRFSERNVAFETRALDMKQKFDRIVPYLALGILVLSAFAVYYSWNVAASLPLE